MSGWCSYFCVQNKGLFEAIATVAIDPKAFSYSVNLNVQCTFLMLFIGIFFFFFHVSITSVIFLNIIGYIATAAIGPNQSSL